MERPDAIFLDAGGVLVLPDAALIAGRLRAASVSFDALQIPTAHYRAVRAWDHDEDQALAYFTALGVPRPQMAAAEEALGPVWALPADRMWRDVPQGTRDTLRYLSDFGIRLAVVSNSDGTVERQLRALGVCQVGEGAGTPVDAVLDSFLLGVAKPDPAIFVQAIEAVGVAAGKCLHVGDSLRADMAGAAAAGVPALHFDPFALCPSADHGHLRSLSELVRRW